MAIDKWLDGQRRVFQEGGNILGRGASFLPYPGKVDDIARLFELGKTPPGINLGEVGIQIPHRGVVQVDERVWGLLRVTFLNNLPGWRTLYLEFRGMERPEPIAQWERRTFSGLNRHIRNSVGGFSYPFDSLVPTEFQLRSFAQDISFKI